MGSSQSSQAHQGHDYEPDPVDFQNVPQHYRLPWIASTLKNVSPLTTDQQDYLNLFEMMHDIFRFCDKDMVIIDTIPNGDGSNLTQTVNDAPVFRHVFDWYKGWLTFLHLAHVREQDWPSIRMLMDQAGQMLAFEKTTYPKYRATGYHELTDDSLKFMDLFRAFADAFQRIMNDANEDLDPSSQLMKELLLNGYKFHKDHIKTHVEDCILYKRITVSELNPQKAAPGSIEDIYAINWYFGKSFLMKQMRQHAFKRPWKQLYLVKDDKDEVQATIIEQIDGLLKTGRPSMVVDVRPMALSKISDDSCSACFTEYSEGELILEQHCGHIAHQECIFSWFDNEERFSFSCPLCRNDPGPIYKKIFNLDENGQKIYVIQNENNPGFESEAVRDEKAFNIWVHELEMNPRYLVDQKKMSNDIPDGQNLRLRALRHREFLIKSYKDEDDAHERGLRNGDLRPFVLPDGTTRDRPAPSVTRQPDPGVRLMYPIEEDGKDHYYIEAKLTVEAYRWLRCRPDAASEAYVTSTKPADMPIEYYASWLEAEEVISAAEKRVKGVLKQPQNHFALQQLLANPKQNPGLEPRDYTIYKDALNGRLEKEFELNLEARFWLWTRPCVCRSQYPLQERPRGPPEGDEMREHHWLAWEGLRVRRRDLESRALAWYAERDPREHPNYRNQRGRIVVEGMEPRLLKAWRNIAGNFAQAIPEEVQGLAPMGTRNPLVQENLPTAEEKDGLRNLDSIPLTEWYERFPNKVPGNMSPAFFVAYKMMREPSFRAEYQVNLPDLTPAEITKAEAEEEKEARRWLRYHPDLEHWMSANRNNIPQDMEHALLPATWRVLDQINLIKVASVRQWMRDSRRQLIKLLSKPSGSARQKLLDKFDYEPPRGEDEGIYEIVRAKPPSERRPEEVAFLEEFELWNELVDSDEKISLGNKLIMPPKGMSTDQWQIWMRMQKPLDQETGRLVRRHHLERFILFLNMFVGDRQFAVEILKDVQQGATPSKPDDVPSSAWQQLKENWIKKPEIWNEVISDTSDDGQMFEEIEFLDEDTEDDIFMGIDENEVRRDIKRVLSESTVGNRANIMLPPKDTDISVSLYQYIVLGDLIEEALQIIDVDWQDDGPLFRALYENRPTPLDFTFRFLPLLPYLYRMFAPDHDRNSLEMVQFNDLALQLWEEDELKAEEWLEQDGNGNKVLTKDNQRPIPPIQETIWLGARRCYFRLHVNWKHQSDAADAVHSHPNAAQIVEEFDYDSPLRPDSIDLPTWRAYHRFRRENGDDIDDPEDAGIWQVIDDVTFQGESVIDSMINVLTEDFRHDPVAAASEATTEVLEEGMYPGNSWQNDVEMLSPLQTDSGIGNPSVMGAENIDYTALPDDEYIDLENVNAHINTDAMTDDEREIFVERLNSLSTALAEYDANYDAMQVDEPLGSTAPSNSNAMDDHEQDMHDSEILDEDSDAEISPMGSRQGGNRGGRLQNAVVSWNRNKLRKPQSDKDKETEMHKTLGPFPQRIEKTTSHQPRISSSSKSQPLTLVLGTIKQNVGR